MPITTSLLKSFLLIFSIASGCITKERHHEISADKLILDVYMETRCPDTEIFVSGQLQPAVQNLGDFFKLNLYPYGKAQEYFDGKRWKFTCQHGPSECEGNTILGCVIPMTNQSTAVHFTACLMKNLDPVSDYKQCCARFNLNVEEVETCARGDKGNKIQHKYAVATSSLNPKLIFIPWIIVNKQFSTPNQDKALNDLKKLLCDNFKSRPPQCS